MGKIKRMKFCPFLFKGVGYLQWICMRWWRGSELLGNALYTVKIHCLAGDQDKGGGSCCDSQSVVQGNDIDLKF